MGPENIIYMYMGKVIIDTKFWKETAISTCLKTFSSQQVRA